MDSVSDADMGNHRIFVRTSGTAKSAAQPHTADNLGYADGNAVFRYYGYLDSAGSDRCVSWKRYLMALSTAVPYIIAYMSSNVVFLMIGLKPLGEKLNRVQTKHGIF